MTNEEWAAATAAIDAKNRAEGNCTTCGGAGEVADVAKITRTGYPFHGKRCPRCRGTGKPRRPCANSARGNGVDLPMSDVTTLRYCRCADPEHCTETIPGYVCLKGSHRTISAQSQLSDEALLALWHATYTPEEAIHVLGFARAVLKRATRLQGDGGIP